MLDPNLHAPYASEKEAAREKLLAELEEIRKAGPRKVGPR